MSKPRALRWAGILPGLLISVLALVSLARLADWHQVGLAWRQVPWWVFLAGWLLFVISMFARVFAWWVMLGGQVSAREALFALNEGYLLNNVLPLRAGELGRAMLLGERSGLGTFFVLSTIVIERVFDLALAAVVLLMTIPLVLSADWVLSGVLTPLLVVAATLSGLYLAARYRSRWTPKVVRFLERWPALKNLLWARLEATLEGFALLTNPAQFGLALGGMVLTWTLAVVEYTFLLHFFAPQAAWWWGAFVLGGAALGVALPSAPAALGVFEAAVVGALTLLGVDYEPALAYAVLAHALHFLTTTLLGAYALSREGQTLLDLWEMVRGVATS